MLSFSINNSRIDAIESLYKFHTTVDVLRLDLIHPLVSGNKWFKLKEYLGEALQLNQRSLLTFGGAYSNHIVATAVAARQYHLDSIGIIRGERPAVLSPTLQDAEASGMKLYFISREAYKEKWIPDTVFENRSKEEIYIINEGGYGALGAEGASSILRDHNTGFYTHIIAAAGTGTTLAGLALGALPHQSVIGIPVLKNYKAMEAEVRYLLKPPYPTIQLLHDFHFGGYAKYNGELLNFMNWWYESTGIPTDIVYTGKLFFAVHHLVTGNFFPEGSSILVIHSGGLQGNRSLPKGKLIFEV